MGAKFVGQKIIMPWTILSMPIPSQSAKSVAGYIKQKIMALGVHFVMGWDMLKKNVRRKTLRWVHLQHIFCKSLWMMRRWLWHTQIGVLFNINSWKIFSKHFIISTLNHYNDHHYSNRWHSLAMGVMMDGN